MGNTSLKDKIVSIMDTFGMTGVKASEIMHISLPAFKIKKAEKNGNYFSEQNLQDLVTYIQTESQKLTSLLV